jgi:hypothetical protein
MIRKYNVHDNTIQQNEQFLSGAANDFIQVSLNWYLVLMLNMVVVDFH